MSDVAAAPLDWVFEGVVPRGKLTVLTGEAGVGKSLIMLEVAAGVTAGDRGPRADRQHEAGAVILFTPEESLADTLRPRLEAAGADLTQVYALHGVREFDDESGVNLAWSFRLDRDLPTLDAELKRLHGEGIAVRLIVIDPFECYLTDAATESKEDADFTAARLTELAASTGMAIVLVSDWSDRLPSGPGTKGMAENLISVATLRRARNESGCKSERESSNGPWYWYLPGHEGASETETADE